MTVGKLNAVCWTLFCVMSFAFMPLLLLVNGLHALPGWLRLALSVFVVLVLWWGPFGYGMYLVQAAMGNGDRHMLKRGVHGTAVVLKAEATNMSIGGGRWTGRVVYRYRLRVSLPGRAPYETYCSVATRGIPEGATVQVAAGRVNRKRVAIDLGQGAGKKLTSDASSAFSARRSAGGTATRSARRGADGGSPRHVEDVRPRVQDARPRIEDARPDAARRGATTDHELDANATRIRQLTELGRLHSQGVLTDEEFAAEKARIIGR